MGRKIPGKKHRTVKDPYKQKQKRLESLRLKINNPPSNADEQEIPKSLLQIIELKNRAKQTAVRRPVRRPARRPVRKNKQPGLLSVAKFLDKEPTPKGMTKPEKFIPNIVQKPNESAESFLGRVSSMTKDLINEVEYEKKFGIEIKKDPKTGEVIEIKNVKKKRSKSKKKLTEKRKEKLKEKEENLKNIKDFSQLKDNVKFGEVVHRPPDLSAIKKKKISNQKPKYGNLLLNTVANNVQTNSKILQKEKAENERKFIVEAYRKVKRYKTG